MVNNTSKVVEGIILWNGVDPYTPPTGTTLVHVDGIQCNVGWIQQPDGSFAPPEDNG